MGRVADWDLASGGGDGPEAVTAGMAATLTELEWRREASKMVVLVADAPPHGELAYRRKVTKLTCIQVLERTVIVC